MHAAARHSVNVASIASQRTGPAGQSGSPDWAGRGCGRGPGPVRRAGAGLRAVLAAEHPDTLTVCANLAALTGGRGMLPRPRTASPRWSRSVSRSWAPSTPTRSPPARTWPTGPGSRRTPSNPWRGIQASESGTVGPDVRVGTQSRSQGGALNWPDGCGDLSKTPHRPLLRGERGPRERGPRERRTGRRAGRGGRHRGGWHRPGVVEPGPEHRTADGQHQRSRRDPHAELGLQPRRLLTPATPGQPECLTARPTTGIIIGLCASEPQRRQGEGGWGSSRAPVVVRVSTQPDISSGSENRT